MAIVKFSSQDGKRRQYKNKAGVKLPGATTVLGKLEKPALLGWACGCGEEQMRQRIIELVEACPDDYPLVDAIKSLNVQKNAHTQISSHAADIGTFAHFAAECYVRGDEADLSAEDPGKVRVAMVSFNKFKSYWDEQGFRIVASELELVSEEHRYGGMLDIVALDRENRVVLPDLKTSKAIYDEHARQLAAYEHLWLENMAAVSAISLDDHPDPKIERRLIIRIGKEEEGDFEVREFGNLDNEWSVFLGALQVYWAMRKSEGGEKTAKTITGKASRPVAKAGRKPKTEKPKKEAKPRGRPKKAKSPIVITGETGVRVVSAGSLVPSQSDNGVPADEWGDDWNESNDVALAQGGNQGVRT